MNDLTKEEEAAMIEKIKEQLDLFEKENPKLSKAIRKANSGEELAPKVKKALDALAETLYNLQEKVQSSNVEEIKKYGLEEEIQISSKEKDELLAQIEYLNKKLEVATEGLEIIASSKTSGKECAIHAQETLEKMTLRKWKKSKK